MIVKTGCDKFSSLRAAKLKLNPEKSVFGIEKGKVLGCLVPSKGMEANPDKINAISNMKPPSNRKKVQKLMGRMAALNRFISKSANKSLPFFKVLRGSSNFKWGSKQQQAFENLKDYLAEKNQANKSRTRRSSIDVCISFVLRSQRSFNAGEKSKKIDGHLSKRKRTI